MNPATGTENPATAVITHCLQNMHNQFNLILCGSKPKFTDDEENTYVFIFETTFPL